MVNTRAFRGNLDTAFIGLELIGDTKGVESMLRQLDSCFSLNGMKDFLGQDVVDYLRHRAEERFIREGDDASGKWAPLRQSTQDIRRAGIRRGDWPMISPAHPINKRTGDMESYITGAKGEVYATNASSALYYPRRSQPPKAKGLRDKVRRAQVGGGSTPARPVLKVSQTDLNAIIWQLAFFIKSRVK